MSKVKVNLQPSDRANRGTNKGFFELCLFTDKEAERTVSRLFKSSKSKVIKKYVKKGL